MLRYCEEHEGFRVRDFRMSPLLDISASTSPPWRGRADGVILGIGASDVTAKEMADWVLEGGVPVARVARESTIRRVAGRRSFDHILQYIATHACSGVTVEQLVKLAGVSRRTLEDRFQRELGRSPGEEIRRVRLEYAKKLLKSDLSVSRIASMVGYEETAAFSKFFRNATGASPRAFRTKAS